MTVKPGVSSSMSLSSGKPIRLRAGWIITEPDSPVFGPCELRTDSEGRISSISSLDDSDLTPAERGRLLMPALADAHDHGRGLRSLACGTIDLPLESWLPELTRQPRVDPYTMAAVAFGRLAKSGICCVYHCHNTQDGRALLAEAEAVSRAARDVGIAVAFAWPFFDHNAYAYGDLARFVSELPFDMRATVTARASALRSADENFALFDQARAFEHRLFRLHFHPVGPQWVRDETLRRIAQASASTGRHIHMHLLETQAQREWADARFEDGLLTHLDRIGLLSPRLTVAHAVWLRPDECDLLAARGVTVSINPSSNLRLRSGCPPVGAMMRAGLAFGIGLDGASLDDDEDMLREMRLLKIGFEPGITADPEREATATLIAAWQTGRRAILGDDRGGILRRGAPADIVVIDYAAISRDCVDRDTPAQYLVLGRAQKKHVIDVYVRGNRIVADGRCQGIDLEALDAELIREAREERKRTPVDIETIGVMRAAVSRFYSSGLHQHGTASD